jgi:hypothetical protein
LLQHRLQPPRTPPQIQAPHILLVLHTLLLLLQVKRLLLYDLKLLLCILDLLDISLDEKHVLALLALERTLTSFLVLEFDRIVLL